MKKLFFFILLFFCFSINSSEASIVDGAVDFIQNIGNEISKTGQEALKQAVQSIIPEKKATPKEQIMQSSGDFFDGVFAYAEESLRSITDLALGLVGNVATFAGTIFASIMLTYALFLVLQYYWTDGLGKPMQDYITRFIKWGIIIALCFSVTFVSWIVRLIYDFDASFSAALFQVPFNVSTLDNITMKAVEAIIPVYNKFETSSVFTDFSGVMSTGFILLAYGFSILFFLVGLFSSYEAFKISLALILSLFPIFAGFLFFDETKNYFSVYMAKIGNIIAQLLFIAVLAQMFITQVSALIEEYFNKTLITTGNAVGNVLGTQTQEAIDKSLVAINYVNLNIPNAIMLTMKLIALVGSFSALIIIIPKITKGLIGGILRTKNKPGL